jgi:hypothetical protein
MRIMVFITAGFRIIRIFYYDNNHLTRHSIQSIEFQEWNVKNFLTIKGRNKMQKPQLSEEERIARKVKIRRIISYIFGVCAFIAIVTFIIFAMGTKKNIDVKTSMDSQELRSKLKQIINLENKYYADNGTYVTINYLTMSKEIPQYNPNLDGSFKYQFDAKTGIATGVENEQDVNGDKDSSDGLTLSVKWEPGVPDKSHFFWTDEDIAEFKQKAAEKGNVPASPQQPASQPAAGSSAGK